MAYDKKYILSIVNFSLDNLNLSCKEISSIFGCSVRSLERWVKKYKDNGAIIHKQRNYISYKVTLNQMNFIINEINNKPNIIIKDLHSNLCNKFPDNIISKQHIYRLLKDNNITRKKAVLMHFPKVYRNKELDHEIEVKKFLNKVNHYDLKDIICIDETSINLDMKIKYCRNISGKRCYLRTDNNKVFRKFSIIFAISNIKTIDYIIYENGSINGARFNEFIKNIVNKNKNKLLIFDNAAIHKMYSTKDIIEKSGNKFLYTVPYSPFLNPIENFFSKLKHNIKLIPISDMNDLLSAIKLSLKNITISDYNNYYIHAYKNKNIFPSHIYNNITLNSIKKYKI